MANNPLPVSKSRIFIGPATGTWTKAAVESGPWTLIGGVRSVPGYGETRQDITVEEVEDARTRHAKGTANGQSMDITCSRRSADAGQIKMAAASLSDESFNVKYELPNGRGGFDVVYHSVLVMGNPTGLGGPNDTQTITFNCQPQEAPIEVPAV